jgi:hypothetical protein
VSPYEQEFPIARCLPDLWFSTRVDLVAIVGSGVSRMNALCLKGRMRHECFGEGFRPGDQGAEKINF